MKEITALWAYTLARAATGVVEYSSELVKVVSGEYFSMDEVEDASGVPLINEGTAIYIRFKWSF
jgi:hypothetical protein